MSDISEIIDRHMAAMKAELAMFHVEPPEPEPDPVRESLAYREMVAVGMSEKNAYEVAEKLLKERITRDRDKQQLVNPMAVVPNDKPNGKGNPEKIPRLGKISILLNDVAVSPKARSLWKQLKKLENKHSKKDEKPAFDLLYPAIEQAAKAIGPGKMTLEQFLDIDKIKKFKAPWDVGPPADPGNDAILLDDIATMLFDLNKTNRKDCQVGPRTTERQEDGSVIEESVPAYHARVQGKHNQMMHMKRMGVIE